MSEETRGLHEALDEHARRSGRPYLHASDPTVQLDLLGSRRVIQWQEGKAAARFASETCWSELPPLYARYGTDATRTLISRVKELEQASAALVCDSGMQATALVFDCLIGPATHAVLMRQVYNKTRSYLEWLCGRVGASLSIVDDGDETAIETAIRPDTRLLFAETFTNPLVRAQDPERLVDIVHGARTRAPELRLVVDSTIATPWAFRTPLLAQGVDIVIGAGTKALGGQDRDLWGYIATRDTQFGNDVMDLLAIRGGILDWRRAEAVLAGLDEADGHHRRRCESATTVARFLAAHPKVSEVFHPSLPTHPDAAVVERHYLRPGSMISFRAREADEERARHIADVLATTLIVRYALSFDGVVSKVNHHKTVSEYFTPEPQLRRNGFDRLIRLAVGLESAVDLVAALNWTLHHADEVTESELEQWQRTRETLLTGHVRVQGAKSKRPTADGR